MEPRIYTSVRVSTREQNEDRQLIALADFGLPDDPIYLDKPNSKNFDRPAVHQEH